MSSFRFICKWFLIFIPTSSLMHALLTHVAFFICRESVYLISSLIGPGLENSACKELWGLPWLSGKKNLPANAGNLGLTPGLGRSGQLLTLCSRARGPQLVSPRALEPVLCNRPSQWEACTAWRPSTARDA